MGGGDRKRKPNRENNCYVLFSSDIKVENATSFIFCIVAVLEELVNTGRLKGTVVGGRQDKAVFIPDIYARTQSNWVDSFFKQNGYLGN